MSSTALSHLPTASQAPLFFRLDTRSQRLVALTDVMQTPLHWLDEPRSAWPAQLPDALRQPIEQRLASGKGGKLVLRFDALLWHISSPTSRTPSGSSACRPSPRRAPPACSCNCRA
jgi:hypothetical protein